LTAKIIRWIFLLQGKTVCLAKSNQGENLFVLDFIFQACLKVPFTNITKTTF